MSPTNFWVVFLIALVPLAVGALYYSKPLFGNAWQKTVGLSDADMAEANMLKIFGLTYVYSIFVTTFLMIVVIHQTSLSGLFGMLPEFAEEGSALWADLNMLDDKYELFTKHRHFGHGVFHGGLFGLLFLGPLISINALFERRNWKYMAINTGYWTICLALIGGLLCQFLDFSFYQ
ncbi:MAG: DUF1761 domain-containing protein [Bacteroidota bacterium]